MPWETRAFLCACIARVLIRRLWFVQSSVCVCVCAPEAVVRAIRVFACVFRRPWFVQSGCVSVNLFVVVVSGGKDRSLGRCAKHGPMVLLVSWRRSTTKFLTC